MLLVGHWFTLLVSDRNNCVKLGIHIRVCGYVMRLAAYGFSAFEYHA